MAIEDPSPGLRPPRSAVTRRAEIVAVLSPAPRDVWNHLLAADPYALETQSPAWIDAMCEARGYRDVSRCYRTAEGRMLVLPFLRSSVLGITGSEAANQPDCGVSGLLAEGGARVGEAAAVLQDLAGRRIIRQAVSPGPLRAGVWIDAAPLGTVTVPHRAHTLDLAGGWEYVWAQRFSRTTRRGVRYAERAGVTVRCGLGGELIPEFDGLARLAARRWASQQHEPPWLAERRRRHRDPASKFEAIARHLGDRLRVWVASVADRPVAASIVLQGRNTYDFRAAMDDTMTGYRANDLLLARSIREACAAGCRYYYLGDSGWGDSRSIFKERFGSEPAYYPEYRFERIPMTRAERIAKTTVKRMIGFKD